MQNPSEASAQNPSVSDTNFGKTDHANSLDFDEAGGLGNTLDSFGHANLTRTSAFSIEVNQIPEPSSSLFAMFGLAGAVMFGLRRRR